MGTATGRTRRRFTALGIALIAAAGAGTAQARTESVTRTAGPITATLSYTNNDQPSDVLRVADLELTVTASDGRPARTFSTADLDYEYPDNMIEPATVVTVRDVNGDGDPDVLVDTYWGGAHCCFETRLVTWSAPQGRFVLTSQLWGNTRPTLRHLNADGIPELVGYDDRFAYALGASYAASIFPARVWVVRGSRFVDVSTRYPALGVRSMRYAWAAYVRVKRIDRTSRANALAAYLAGASNAGPAQRRLAWRRAVAAEARTPAVLRSVRRQLERWGYRVVR